MTSPSSQTLAIRFELAKAVDDDYQGVTHIDFHFRHASRWVDATRSVQELGKKFQDEMDWHLPTDLLGEDVQAADFDVVVFPNATEPTDLPGHWYRPGPESGSLAARACGCGVNCSKIVIRHYTNQWHIWHTNKDIEVRLESASNPHLFTDTTGLLGAIEWADKLVGSLTTSEWISINEASAAGFPTRSCS